MAKKKKAKVDLSFVRAEVARRLGKLQEFQLRPKAGRQPLSSAVYLGEVYLIARAASKLGSFKAVPTIQAWREANPVDGAITPRAHSVEAEIITATSKASKQELSKWVKALSKVHSLYAYKLTRLDFDAVLSGLGGIIGAASSRKVTPKPFGKSKVARKKTSKDGDWWK